MRRDRAGFNLKKKKEKEKKSERDVTWPNCSLAITLKCKEKPRKRIINIIKLYMPIHPRELEMKPESDNFHEVSYLDLS